MNLYQDAFFRSLDLLRGRRTIERLKFLRDSQFWDRGTLRAWQLDRLNALLLQARDHTPFYGRTLAQVRLPLRSIEELSDLPVLSKRDIRTQFAGLQSGNIPRDRFVQSRTGGSTGEPTHYFWDKRGMDWNRASVYRSAEWAGVALGERTVQMSGSHFDETEGQKARNRLVFLLQRYRDYPVAAMTQELLERYYIDIKRFRPTSIWGYASGLNAFARFITKHHPDSRLDFVKAVVPSSETLFPEQRQSIEHAFGTGTVYDNYGSREMYMAAECHAHAGYHLHSEVVHTEVVDSNNQPCAPGTLGRILVTDLSNHAFPFIRYEIGDVGIMAEDAPCPCGVKLPRLQSVVGRVADLVVLRDRILTPPNFTILFSDIPGVDAYQIRQDSVDQIDLHVVPGPDYSSVVETYIRSSVQSMAGPHVTVSLTLVDGIAVPESGKRRYVVSTVNQSAVPP